MKTSENKDSNLTIILYLNFSIFLIGLIIVAIVDFSLKNLLSFFLGAFIITLNFYWLKKLASKLITDGQFKKKTAIEWAAKILVVFGSISLIILKFPINILIFIFGLSILPIAVLLSSFILYFKR